MEHRAARRGPLNNRTPRRGGPTLQATLQTPVKDATELVGKHLMAVLDKHSARLVRWAGIASICGGMLWILFVTLLHMQTFGIGPLDDFYTDLYYATSFESLLALPLLLFICTAIGILALQNKSPSRLGYIGVILIFSGLGLSAGKTIYYYWLGHRWDSWNGLGPDLLPYSWVEWWLPSVRTGLFILTLGLMLLLSANRRSKVLPTKATLFLAATLIVLLMLPLIIANESLLFDQFGFMLWSLAISGFAWILMGAALLRRGWKSPQFAGK